MPDTYTSVADWQAQTAVPKSGGRRPNRWAPNGGFVVPNAAAITQSAGFVMVAGSRPGRNTIVIINTGTVSLLIVDGPQTTTPITLGVGAVFTLEAEGEVWVKAPGSTDGLIDVFETWWDFLAAGPGGPIADVGNIPDVLPTVHPFVDVLR